MAKKIETPTAYTVTFNKVSREFSTDGIHPDQWAYIITKGLETVHRGFATTVANGMKPDDAPADWKPTPEQSGEALDAAHVRMGTDEVNLRGTSNLTEHGITERELEGVQRQAARAWLRSVKSLGDKAPAGHQKAVAFYDAKDTQEARDAAALALYGRIGQTAVAQEAFAAALEKAQEARRKAKGPNVDVADLGDVDLDGLI